MHVIVFCHFRAGAHNLYVRESLLSRWCQRSMICEWSYVSGPLCVLFYIFTLVKLAVAIPHERMSHGLGGWILSFDQQNPA